MTNRPERGRAPQFDITKHVVRIFVHKYILCTSLGHSVRSSYNFHGASLLYGHFVAAALIPVVSSNFFRSVLFFVVTIFPPTHSSLFLLSMPLFLPVGKEKCEYLMRNMWNRTRITRTVNKEFERICVKMNCSPDDTDHHAFVWFRWSFRKKYTTFFFRHCFVQYGIVLYLERRWRRENVKISELFAQVR